MKRKKEFVKICLVGLLSFNMIMLSACSMLGLEKKENLAGKNIETKSVSVALSEKKEETKVGSLTENGYEIMAEEESLPDGAKITVTPSAEDEKKKLLGTGKFSEIGNAFHIESESYQGEFFDKDILLTTPIPTAIDEKTDLGSYTFIYFDEEKEAIRYLFPTSFDLDKGTMTLRLPHFSFFAPTKLSEKEQVEAFLNSYSTKLAVERGKMKKMAKELEPYVKAKAKALDLTKEATADLVQSTLNYIGGRFEGDYKDTIETGTKAGTSFIRAAVDGDMDGLKSNLEDVVNGAIMHVWEDEGYNKKIDKVFNTKNLGKAGEKVVGNINGVVKMAGYLIEGDVKNGMKEFGGILQNTHPAAEFVTKGARFLGTLADTGFTYWKSNEVEELFHIYKNGGRGVAGSEIIPQDEESFLNYVYYGREFSKGKAMMRFLNQDKLKDFFARSDWTEEDYQNLPEKTRRNFEEKSVQGLLDYFKLRIEQEEEARRIKEEERICIEEMLQSSIGALKSYNYGKFFGEESEKDFDITRRMERLVRVRNYISRFVDEDKLKKLNKLEKGYNYGDIINNWVYFASNMPKKDAIFELKKYLKKIGALKSEAGFGEGNMTFICTRNDVDYTSFPEDKREMQDSSLIEQAIRQGVAKAKLSLKEDGSFSVSVKKVEDENEASDKTGEKGEFEHVHRYYSLLKDIKIVGKIDFENSENSRLKGFYADAVGSYRYSFIIHNKGGDHKCVTEIKSAAKWKEKKKDKVEFYEAEGDDGKTYQFIRIQTQIKIPKKVKKIQSSTSKGVEEEKEIKITLPSNLDLIYRSENPVN